MKITKYAHSCLLIEEENARILIDPGSWNETPSAENLDAIFITHEHQDHFDIGQIREVLKRNPDAVVITQESVGRLLVEEGIGCTTMKAEEVVEVAGVRVQSFGRDHAIIYGATSPCQNTGYLIAERLYVPGDALHDMPGAPVEILALPTGGPWMKIAEAIEYAKKVGPSVVFPIHDAMYVESYQRELIPRIVGGNLESVDIEFRDMAAGATKVF